MIFIGDRPKHEIAALEVAKKTDMQVYDSLINKLEGTFFRELSTEDRFKLIVQIIAQCKVYTGQKNVVSDSIHESQTQEAIYDGIMLNYFNLTDKEILHAVKLGLLGTYGTNGGIVMVTIVMVTPIQIFEWLKSYVNSVKTKANKILIEERSKSKNEEQKELTQDEIDKIREESIKSLINDIVSKKLTNSVSGHVVYNYLYEKKNLRPSEHERLKFLQKATKIIENEYRQKAVYDRNMRNKLQEIIQGKGQKQIQNLAKSLFICEYLNKYGDVGV
jgi:hypothetical protein